MNKNRSQEDARTGIAERAGVQPSGFWNTLSGSLQGRIAVFAVLSCAALLVGATTVFILTQKASVPAVANLKGRQQTQSGLQALRSEIEQAENSLRRYLISPDAHVEQEIFTHLGSYADGLRLLRKSHWVSASQDLAAQVDAQITRAPELNADIRELVEVRKDNTRLFPTMPVMLDEMLPANTEFYTAATLAMNALEADAGTGDEHALLQFRAFSEARHQWSRMVGEFRLYIANRFGTFGDPVRGIESRLKNIELYAEAVDRQLELIAGWKSSGRLSMETEASATVMPEAKAEWFVAFTKVLGMFENKEWRTDLTILRERVDPHFVSVRNSLDSLSRALDETTENDINVLTWTGKQVAQYLLIFALLGVIVSVAFYMVFRRSVLVPIEKVASALRAESKVVTQESDDLKKRVTIPAATTREAHDLVTAFNEMREQVWVRQQRLANILDNAAEGIVTFDDDGKIQTCNAAAQRLFAYDSVERHNDLHIDQLIPPEHIKVKKEINSYRGRELYLALVGEDVEALGVRLDGETITVSLKLTAMETSGQRIFTGLVADISDRKALMDHLRHLAERDALTGLLNRVEFERNLDRILQQAEQDRGESTLLYMDLDQFKVLNDTCGHVAGDESLRQLAVIIKEQVRAGDLVARLGGDEFAVLLDGCPLPKGIRIAEQIRERVRDHRFAWNTSTGNLSVSIGVVAISSNSKSTVDVLNAADRACYAAKDRGRNNVYVYRESDAELAKRRTEMVWVSRINTALEESRFYLVAQPIVANTRRDIPARRFWELLLRMVGEDGEIVSPGSYFPAAERYDMLLSLDNWVTRTALAWLADVKNDMDGDELFALNVTGHSIGNKQFTEGLLAQLDRTAVSAHNLCFEITETAAVTHLQNAARFMDIFRQRGAHFALDDFGSGLSSFGFLKNLQVDFLKIDGAFVKDINSDPIDREMVCSINGIGHLMDIQTIAEWVETPVIAQQVEEIGVDYMQGTAIGEPVSLSELVLPAAASVADVV